MIPGIVASAMNSATLGGPVPPAADWEVLEHKSAPVDGAFDFSGLDLQGYQRIVLMLNDVTVDTDGTSILVNVAIDTALQAEDYQWRLHSGSSGGSVEEGASTASSTLLIAGDSDDSNFNVGNAATESYSGRVEIGNAGAGAKLFETDGVLVGPTGAAVRITTGGLLPDTGALTEIVVVGSAGGVIDGGTATLYALPSTDRTPDPQSPELLSMWVGAVL